jgi:arabinofuranosyltransferase
MTEPTHGERIVGEAGGERVFIACLLVLAAFGLCVGWKVFWFLTDDAYIGFRYVSNAMRGFGYVWNPPPFLPVEGYTCFLWVALLHGVWRCTGVAPPDAANVLALIFSYLTLVTSVLLLLRLEWKPALRRWRLDFVALLLVFLLLNRSFLMWTSSGLETALFCFLVTAWVFSTTVPAKPLTRAFWGSSTAALLALTRPDGLLFCLAAAWVVGTSALRTAGPVKARRILWIGLAPFAVVLVHLLWRRHRYGAWLPNTYYAKVVEAWPESGLLYVSSFILEYGLWFAAALLLWGAVKALLRRRRAEDRSWLAAALFHGPVIAVLTLAAHFGYYTLIVGGDHFEYRVYNHLFPFLFIALVWGLNQLDLRGSVALALACVFVLLSLPLPWTHWALTRDLHTRGETYRMRVPVAPTWPAPFRWYARLFDQAQSRLIYHHACMRHQEHKVFWQYQIARYPTREEGSRISAEGFPVYPQKGVGVPSWVLPNVNIIDIFGLNDYVVARTPVPADKVRYMAHTRKALPAYIESFRPNVSLERGRVIVRERATPLTAAEIVQLEAEWRQKVRDQ